MWPIFRAMSPAEKERQAPNHRRPLETLREMHKVRDFRPVLCVNVWDPVGRDAVCELRHAVYELNELRRAVALEREVDDFFSKLSIISIPQGSRPLNLERISAYYGTPWTPL